MVRGPALYSEIGKKTRDYHSDQKITVTTVSPVGVAITHPATKKGELFAADVTTQRKNNNVTTDIKVDTDSNIHATITVDELAPGVKTIYSFKVPDQRSGKVNETVHKIFNGDLIITFGGSIHIGLTASPVVNFSGVIGSDAVSLGTDLSFDIKTGNFSKYSAGLSYANEDIVAALTLNDKGDSLVASYYHNVNLFTAVGAEVGHSFSSNQTTMTVGTHHVLDPLTTLKARVNNNGKASALIQREWRPRSYFTVTGEVDTKAIEKSAKVGLALALKL